MVTNSNVIIIGAGLSGLAASLGLAELGYSVDIVEKRTSFSSKGSAFGIHPSGIKALEELCADAVPSIVEAGTRIPQTGGLLVPWFSIRDSLLHQVMLYPDKITIRTGAQIQELNDGADCVRATVRFDDGTTENLTGSLLLGCDGVNSSVRKMLGLSPARLSGASIWRGNIEVQPGGKLFSLLSDGILPMGAVKAGPITFVLFNFHESLPNTMAWGASTKDVTPEGTSLWPVMEPFVENERERGLLKEIFDLTTEEELCNPMNIRTVNPCPKPDSVEAGGGWGGRGRITLLGDSAHALRPASGLGGAMAFEDGVILCRCLKNADTKGKEEVDIVSRFESARLPRVSKIWDIEWEVAEKNYEEFPSEKAKELLAFHKSKEYTDWLRAGV